MKKFKIYVSERGKETIESKLKEVGLIDKDKELESLFGAQIVITPKVEIEEKN